MSESNLRQQAAQIFFDAADYIRSYGWQEKGMGKHGEPRCSMGALASAYPKQAWNKRLASLMYEALYKELNGTNLTDFNRRFKDGQKVARLYEQVATNLKTG